MAARGRAGRRGHGRGRPGVRVDVDGNTAARCWGRAGRYGGAAARPQHRAAIVQLDTGRFLMPNLEQAPTDNTAAGSGVIAPAPPADGVPGDAGFAETGSRTDGGAVGRPARVTGVPVNLKTSSPTF